MQQFNLDLFRQYNSSRLANIAQGGVWVANMTKCLIIVEMPSELRYNRNREIVDCSTAGSDMCRLNGRTLCKGVQLQARRTGQCCVL